MIFIAANIIRSSSLCILINILINLDWSERKGIFKFKLVAIGLEIQPYVYVTGSKFVHSSLNQTPLKETFDEFSTCGIKRCSF